ncbi:hypothetical protein, partial [Campylobacter rectus]|uniref:hypothetical protein n=1 Tax=Campylobacter rectus TaxID=203 RepID=UPI0023F24C6C
MHFIEGIIYFGIYAVFVLILTSIYVVFFEKTVKAKMHKSENLEREKVRNMLKRHTIRNYDKRPIIVKNDYKIKIAFITTTVFVLLSLFLICNNLEPKLDSFDEHIRKAALAAGVIGILGSAYFSAVLFFENRKKIYTRIYGDYLLHDPYGESSKFFKAHADQIRLEFNDDLQIGYGFYPVEGEAKDYAPSGKNFNEKYENALAFPIVFALKLAFTAMFFVLSAFKFKKYYIFKNDKFVVSVLANNELEDRFGKVGFEILTLTHIV